MDSSKKNKVIVVGLPKTGTSTLAIMLRILGYQVTGPEINFKKGDSVFLNKRFNSYDGFQDYPWCFEWEYFFNNNKSKFIILIRDKEEWWNSFYGSYGREENNYLSFSYIGLRKCIENKTEFLTYFENYYKRAFEFKNKFPDRFLVVDIKTFQWKDLCLFLNEEVPTNIFGKVINKPHVNKNRKAKKDTFKFKIITKLRKVLLPTLGEKNWNKTIVFLRKNNLYK